MSAAPVLEARRVLSCARCRVPLVTDGDAVWCGLCEAVAAPVVQRPKPATCPAWRADELRRVDELTAAGWLDDEIGAELGRCTRSIQRARQKGLARRYTTGERLALTRERRAAMYRANWLARRLRNEPTEPPRWPVGGCIGGRGHDFDGPGGACVDCGVDCGFERRAD